MTLVVKGNHKYTNTMQSTESGTSATEL